MTDPAAPPMEPTFNPTDPPDNARHPFPPALIAAIGLYIATWPIGMAAWFAGEPRHFTPDQEAAFMGLGCSAVVLLPIELGSLILACFGWRWAAIVYAAVTAVGLLISIPLYGIIGFGVFDAAYVAVWIGSALCLLAPGARSYYSWSAHFRAARA